MSGAPMPPAGTARVSTPSWGTVHLVGAGPGDPGLLTVRAAELLAVCDCVIHDYLVNPAILKLIPSAVPRIDVGKRGHADSVSQGAINAQLVVSARDHRCVVRLKGGDPFLFGRGGEEADHLAAAGVPFAIVPGVTSGIAVPAYAGIPITHRAKSSAVVFATGHRRPGADDSEHWRALAHIETIVLYMGMQKLADLTAAVIAHGRHPDTPAAVIQWGTYGRQRTCTATLRDIAAKAHAEGLGAPAITVIGDVCAYRERIRWFDNRSLSGKRILVTRARSQASALSQQFSALGAEVIEVPLATVEAPTSTAELDALCAGAAPDWLAFTSVNAVEHWWARLRAGNRDGRALADCRLAVVGAGTAAALRQCGLYPDLIAEPAHAAHLGQQLLTTGPERARVGLPQADNARPILADALRRGGWQVTEVVAYRTVPIAEPDLSDCVDLHAATFASAATAERFVAALPPAQLADLLRSGMRCFAIGPETAAAMRRCGLPVHGIADRADPAALAQVVTLTLNQP